jgi:hypothetical protein
MDDGITASPNAAASAFTARQPVQWADEARRPLARALLDQGLAPCVAAQLAVVRFSANPAALIPASAHAASSLGASPDTPTAPMSCFPSCE